MQNLSKIEKRTTRWVAGAHIVAIVGLLLWTAWVRLIPTPGPEDPYIFEMIAPPSGQVMGDITPEPPVEPIPPEPPPPPRINIDEFRRENPARRPDPPRREPSPRQQVDIPPIRMEEIQRNLNSLIATESAQIRASRLSLAEQDALERYFGALRARIDLNWNQPRNLAGSNLFAEVTFVISARGEISEIRFSRASGNAEFDRSVREAFARAGNHGATPDGRSHELRLPFRLSPTQ